MLFERIGGGAAIDRLVEAFYDRMDILPEARGIRAMHADDLGGAKRILKQYLVEWCGGPKLYSQERGHPRLRQRHMGFEIGAEERDAWLLCMREALAVCVVDPEARGELYEAMARLADWMRNRADAGADPAWRARLERDH